MLELAAELAAELDAGRSVAVVTVVGVPGRSPRSAGAALALTPDGRILGSLAGGCIDGDAVLLASSALATGSSARARFGIGDADAHAAGLACGGSVDVVACLLRPDDAVVAAVLDAVVRGRAARLAVALNGSDGARGVPEESLPGRAWSAADPAAGVSEDGGLLVVSRPSRPGLVIVGANEHAAALCRLAVAAGYAVTVCDPWEALVTPSRFPGAARLVADLPHAWLARAEGVHPSTTAVCVLAHDERIDVPALRAALRHPFAFVGAMGSRATTARRLALLADAGVEADDLARLHMPLGLDLGGAEPAEVAVSVLAEIVRARHAASGLPLQDLAGPIHRPFASLTPVAAPC